jgi:large subunit ribosomal protein L25
VTLGATRRTEAGKGTARQLRLQGRIPAVIYGHGRDAEWLTLSEKELALALKGVEVGTAVFELGLESGPVKALVREIQRHPYKPEILHVDFYEIHAGERVTLNLPIHLVGSPDGVRNGGGVLDQVMRDVQIRVLVTDIPDRLDVDVTSLHVGQSLHVRDLQIANVVILTDPDKTICSVVAPKVEVEPVPGTPVEVAEPEVIRKAKEEPEAEGGEE